jgi:hypothetical protein
MIFDGRIMPRGSARINPSERGTPTRSQPEGFKSFPEISFPRAQTGYG